MKFMLMIIDNEPDEAALPPAEIDKVLAAHGVVDRELRQAGKWVCSTRLRYGAEATTLRRRGGSVVATDGPFAESKELLGGFYLIEADAMDEAVAWAKKLPLFDTGGIEVRPARTGATWRGPVRGTQRFMVMFIANAEQPMSKAEVFDAIDAHYEVSLDLAAQGKFVGSRALEPSAAAKTIRKRNGHPVVLDGPFAESKEFVAGYFIIACDSKQEALRWAEQLMARSDACEVRPVWET